MPRVTSERIVRALLKHPELLVDVRQRLMNVRACGPWMNTGKRFGNPDTRNVWGLPKAPKNKKEQALFKENPNDAHARKFACTVRPAEEWGDEMGGDFPGKWYWNVDSGIEAHKGSGITDSLPEGKAAAEAHLESVGWIIVRG